MEKFRWINTWTGELYHSLPHAIKTIVKDMIRFPGCRDLHMFRIRRFKDR